MLEPKPKEEGGEGVAAGAKTAKKSAKKTAKKK